MCIRDRLLVVITIVANYILIPIYGIDGAAMATALSVFLFNLIRLFLIRVKIGMHPFSFNTIKTILLLIGLFVVMNYLPNTENDFVDILWRSVLVLVIYIPLVLYLNLSEDISAIIKELKAKYIN